MLTLLMLFLIAFAIFTLLTETDFLLFVGLAFLGIAIFVVIVVIKNKIKNKNKDRDNE